MLQGGDYELGTGFGGTSVCGQAFPDENFAKKHDKKGKTHKAIQQGSSVVHLPKCVRSSNLE